MSKITPQPQILFTIQFFEIGFVLSPANNSVNLKQDPQKQRKSNIFKQKVHEKRTAYEGKTGK
jgi:hypothetical protein